MRLIWLILISFLLFGSVGCYSNPSYQREIAILRGEIIDLENKYYSIKSRYESTLIELEHCRGDEMGSRPNGNAEEIFGRPKQNEKLPGQINDDDGMPQIDDGNSGNDNSGGIGDGEGGDGFLTGPENRKQTVSDQRDADPDSWVRDIRLDRQLTQAQNFDGKPGDDGALIVVQPVDEEGNVIPVAGKMTISIIDSKEKGQRQRIGFYELNEKDAEPLIETSDALGAGIHVRVNWNRNLPRNRMVRIFVRFETGSGQRFEASLPIHVSTTDSQADQWTQGNGPRSSGPVKPASATRQPRWQPRRR